MASGLLDPPSDYHDIKLSEAWVSYPTRTTIMIIQSCLATFVLSAWTMQHPDIPSRGERKASKFRQFVLKAGRFCSALLLPEMTLLRAIQEYVRARYFCNSLAQEPEYPGESIPIESNYHWPWYYVIPIPDPTLDTEAQSTKSATGIRRFLEWVKPKKLDLAFYACMGGYELIGPQEAQYTTLLPSSVMIMTKLGGVVKKLPEEVSKADVFTKLIACFQGLWMVIQVIARVTGGLRITLLEFNAIMHIVSALVAYLLWINKPQNIKLPTKVLANSFFGSTSTKGGGPRPDLKTSSDNIDNTDLKEIAMIPPNRTDSANSNPDTAKSERVEWPLLLLCVIEVHKTESESGSSDINSKGSNKKLISKNFGALHYTQGAGVRMAMVDGKSTATSDVDVDDGTAAGKWLLIEPSRSGKAKEQPVRRLIWPLKEEGPTAPEVPAETGQTVVDIDNELAEKGQTAIEKEVAATEKELAPVGYRGPVAIKRIIITQRTWVEDETAWKVKEKKTLIKFQGEMVVNRPAAEFLLKFCLGQTSIQREGPGGGKFQVTWDDYLDVVKKANGLAELQSTVPLRWSDLRKQRSKVYWWLSFLIFSIAYGGIHLAPWNNYFPTLLERYLWRISGIVAMVGLPILHGTFITVFWLSSKLTRVSAPKALEIVVQVLSWILIILVLLLMLSISLVSAAARLYMITEGFASLRSLPFEAYENIPWVEYLPHF